jgi:peptidoglycan/LPS O-acetylase OafA/YrhL
LGGALAISTVVTGGNTFGPDGTNWLLGVMRVGWAYTLGICLARLYRSRKWSAVCSCTEALALVIIVYITLPLLPNVGIVDAVFIVVVMPALFWLVVIGETPAGRTGRLMSILGAVSFPLYAFHMPVFSAVLSVGVSVYTGIVAAIIALSLATLVTLLSADRTQSVWNVRRART